ncbi:MAG: shikimate dehydrogenase [Campylobacteraceae bacterium 4484_4]|nr:MAG: shikimate dehydrogenase [Campylobacteraceae bacterium 4484_4]
MKHFTIFGDPVEHSISPIMHTYAIEGLGLNATYTKTRLKDPTRLKPMFLERFDGANVTVPHKEAAFLQCDLIRGIAKEIGAVNTLVKKEGKMIGYNTDAEGFYRSIEPFGEISCAMILGAGGSARAIAYILRQKGIEVTILNRTASRLEAFKAFKTMTWERYSSGSYDLLINTTSAGLSEEILPAPEAIMKDLFSHTKYAVDIIYNKLTPFLQMAEAYHVPAKDGADMLLYQGVLAFNLFYDNRFEFEEIEKYMRKAFV